MHPRRMSVAALLALSLGWLLSPGAAFARKEIQIGDAISGLTFKDIRYLVRSLNDFQDKKAFVMVLTTTSCPLVARYWPTLKELERDYRAKGVQFLSVNVS